MGILVEENNVEWVVAEVSRLAVEEENWVVEVVNGCSRVEWVVEALVMGKPEEEMVAKVKEKVEVEMVVEGIAERVKEEVVKGEVEVVARVEEMVEVEVETVVKGEVEMVEEGKVAVAKVEEEMEAAVREMGVVEKVEEEMEAAVREMGVVAMAEVVMEMAEIGKAAVVTELEVEMGEEAQIAAAAAAMVMAEEIVSAATVAMTAGAEQTERSGRSCSSPEDAGMPHIALAFAATDGQAGSFAGHQTTIP
ncbi:hypothetical protein IEQ34_022770 [Dendrobium chrysotoxum]|uniref:Uncharacterized protein n=1 Tax=Dendrobium chrysotoxum TaxID=161865 RepID=A0AAV7FZX9_DENCH|nr:hypothetical protein IEQ34_022770 [Dendrobium chrysotoxum]